MSLLTNSRFAAAAAVAIALAGTAAAQSNSPAQKTPPPHKIAGATNWVLTKTADGQPNLEGIWDAASLTPLQRPKELGNKAYYTKEEAAAFAANRKKENDRDRRDGGATADLGRAYNEGWFDKGEMLGRNLRTSRLIDPPDGQFPPFTPEAQKKFDEFHAWFAKNPADRAQDRTLFDRCLYFSQSSPPIIPGNYNNMYQIVQTPGQVTIVSEMGHQTRVIPLVDRGREHAKLPKSVPQWMGDSVGHWEGNTLVIESSNFRVDRQSHFGTQYEGMSDENMKVVERFTRTAADLIIYQATVTDPTIYTAPWTIELPLSKTEGPIYEYACHEGNYGLSGILSGQREIEKEQAAETKK